MILTWEDGYTIELPFYAKTVGLTHNRKRPISVTIEVGEINNSSLTPEQLKRYISRLVLCKH